MIDISAMGLEPLPVIRQRDRLVDVLSHLSADEWAVERRCAGWSVQDVAEHLTGVNQFFVLSIGGGLRNEPTRMLATFDPVKVPAAMVEGARGAAPTVTLDKLASSCAELAALLRSVTANDVQKLAEAPPGHLAIDAVFAHALWDAWVHERDILLPLGREQDLEPDEITMALAYVAALGPACYVNAGQAVTQSLAVRARNPSVDFVVQVSQQITVCPSAPSEAAAVVEGDSVDLVEALSCRAPQPEVSEGHRWLVDGLHKLFNPAV